MQQATKMLDEVGTSEYLNVASSNANADYAFWDIIDLRYARLP